MGCVCAAGPDLPGSLQGIFAGHRRVAVPQRFSTSHAVRYPVFEIPDSFLECNGLQIHKEYSLTVKYALHASAAALNQAGWSEEDLSKLTVGVCMGTTVGSTLNSEEFYREYLQGGVPDMEPVHMFLDGNPAEAVARATGFSGPCQTVVNACSSGTDAIGIGAEWIESGLCDVVLAGGTDELCRTTYNGFASLMIMDAEPCRPFDKSRAGLNLGEGAGVMVLESSSLRNKGKKKILGSVLGYGSACDAYHLTAPHPRGSGLRRAMSQALELSRADTSEVAFVNAHGTGTMDNDRVEATVLNEILPDTPFLSTKGYTGHTLGAAGGIEAVFTLSCLNMGRIPASAGFSQCDPALDMAPVKKNTFIAGQVAVSQSLAFGGNNGVLVLQGCRY